MHVFISKYYCNKKRYFRAISIYFYIKHVKPANVNVLKVLETFLKLLFHFFSDYLQQHANITPSFVACSFTSQNY